MDVNSLAERIFMETGEEVKIREPMSKHTSLRIGGPADIFVSPRGVENLMKILKIAKAEKIRRFIIGNGTNILVSDEGIRGMVIQIKSGFSRMMVKERKDFVALKAEAGTRLSRVLSYTKKLGLKGFEFAAGIPGSIGGAVMMNAGTKLGEISHITHSLEVIDKSGNIKKLKKSELDFSYRKLNMPGSTVILNGVFKLKYGDIKEVAKNIDDFMRERRSLQPKGRSAGCIFKNPKNGSAGRIIDELGMKGRRIGGAYVSNVHANFIMNDGTATCGDFITLIREVRDTVKKETGIKLDYEINFLGNM